MLKLLAAVDVAGAKAVVIGDHRQLGAVGPGGGLEALVNRYGPAVHVLEENIRQRIPPSAEPPRSCAPAASPQRPSGTEPTTASSSLRPGTERSTQPSKPGSPTSELVERPS
ncbi:MAG: AAA family ATPase [Acidimicrobiia bacterium]